MAYADYSYYTDTYKGKAIPSADFERLAMRASSYLDQKVSCIETIATSDKVKMATCAVAEAWQINEQGGDVASQSVGSWSQSFSKSAKTDSERLFEAAKLYLDGLISKVRWA